MAENNNNNNNVEDEQKVHTDTDKLPQSKEELDKLIQSESDRKTALAQKQWKQRTEKQLEEAGKLAKMDAEERSAYELNSVKEELEQMKRDRAKSENTAETLKVLANRELPAELLEYVLTEDADTTLTKITDLQGIIKKLIQNEVDKRLPKSNGAPKSGNVSKTLTKEDFAKMTVTHSIVQILIYSKHYPKNNKET